MSKLRDFNSQIKYYSPSSRQSIVGLCNLVLRATRSTKHVIEVRNSYELRPLQTTRARRQGAARGPPPPPSCPPLHPTPPLHTQHTPQHPTSLPTSPPHPTAPPHLTAPAHPPQHRPAPAHPPQHPAAPTHPAQHPTAPAHPPQHPAVPAHPPQHPTSVAHSLSHHTSSSHSPQHPTSPLHSPEHSTSPPHLSPIYFEPIHTIYPSLPEGPILRARRQRVAAREQHLHLSSSSPSFTNPPSPHRSTRRRGVRVRRVAVGRRVPQFYGESSMAGSSSGQNSSSAYEKLKNINRNTLSHCVAKRDSVLGEQYRHAKIIISLFEILYNSCTFFPDGMDARLLSNTLEVTRDELLDALANTGLRMKHFNPLINGMGRILLDPIGGDSDSAEKERDELIAISMKYKNELDELEKWEGIAGTPT